MIGPVTLVVASSASDSGAASPTIGVGMLIGIVTVGVLLIGLALRYAMGPR